jgi:uncharacterized oxidoreductase
MDKTISKDDLEDHCARILQAAGSSAEEARCVATNLVLANLSGHDSHGVGMIPRYVAAVQEGGLRPNAELRTTLDIGTLLALDGQRGYGQVVGAQAMRLAMARARQHGSCIMTLAQAHHLGRIGHFAEMAVAEGLVSLHFVNVLARPIVAPWGGADGRFGTNPCCIGIPLQGREPFLLDLATSRVAQGKMRVAHNRGERVDAGLLIDERGRPTTDPGVVVVPQSEGLFGALRAFGEHKGYGLAVACELLGGALTGSGTWHRSGPYGQSVVNGMLSILIDPSRLGTQEAFASESLAFVEWLKQGPVAEGASGVLLAGEPERAARRERAREGIVIDRQTWQDITQAAQSVGLDAQ